MSGGYDKARDEMVATQIASRGVDDRRVLEAMRKVPRERFVAEEDRELAFYDGPLSIGCGQTISQPYIVAYMTEMLDLDGSETVLEIGTGCGYQTAVLAELAAAVFTVEIVDELAVRARRILDGLGYTNIEFRSGDGGLRLFDERRFDAIMVTAAPAEIPKILLESLADGGRMILPIGAYEQYLVLVRRVGDRFEEKRLIGVRFVPMTGCVERENE